MSRASLKTKTYDRVKEMILSGQLRPGETIAERDLGTKLGVSRTPVREALLRLQQEGLIADRPRRGRVVQVIDAKAVEDLYELRDLLEQHSAKLAVGRATKEDKAKIQRLAVALKKYEGDDIQGVDELRDSQKVHEIICEAARNDLLFEMLMRVYDRLQMFIWLDALYADEASTTRKEHQEIIAAFLAQDERQLVKLTRDHLRRSKDNVIRALRARPSLSL